jgi:hypothetical protein
MSLEGKMAIDVAEWERRRALYLGELTFEAGVWRDQAIHASQGAIDFSKEAINAIYFLNGGGIGVIATAATLLKMDSALAVGLSIPFFVGLLAALVCNFCAYFTQIYLHDRYDREYWREYNLTKQLYFPELHGEETAALITNLEMERDTAGEKSRRFRYVAIVFAVIGILAFATGGLRFICATT